MNLSIPPASSTMWDIVALGEVLLRLDPGESRIQASRDFRVWEGGGEYNVARNLSRTFGMRATIVTALVDNPIGRLVESLMLQGGVDQRHVHWFPFDGVGRSARNGLNFTERGFGIRAGVGCYDRAYTAISQLRPSDVDWHTVFGDERARWFHTGGIFAALSETSAGVAREAMVAAREHGTVVSYDLNYRPSLWNAVGGRPVAQEVNRQLVRQADVLFGNEEDFGAALGFEVEGVGDDLTDLDPSSFAAMINRVVMEYPNLRMVAVTMRSAPTSTRNDWSALLWSEARLFRSRAYRDLEVLDRVGSGDGFASGLVYGLLTGQPTSIALDLGVAHGALVMTTPGDNSMATLGEVERAIRSQSARISR